MFGYDLGIDLGTTNIVIGVPGKGIRLDEPAYVAYDEEKEKVLYAGKRAYFLEGREPEGLRVERPILSGVVGHYELAQQMMRHFINKVIGNSLFKPRVVVSVPAMRRLSSSCERCTTWLVVCAPQRRSSARWPVLCPERKM